MFTWSVRRVFALVSASLLLLLTTAGVASAQGPPQIHLGRTQPGRACHERRCGGVVPVGRHRRDWSSRSLDADEASLGWRPDHRHPAAPSFRRGRQPDLLDRTALPGGREPERNGHLQRLSRLETAPSWAHWSPRSTRRGSCASRRTRSSPPHRPEDLTLWRTSEVTVFSTTGSGYDKITTARNLSPNGQLQTAATSKGTITVQRTSDGSIVRTLSGGTRPAFSPDSSMIAEWTASPTRSGCTGSPTARW